MDSPGNKELRWAEGVPYALTVCDNDGVVIWMNDAAARHYARFGGKDRIGRSMLDCHPEPARKIVQRMLAEPGVNVYTIEKAGRRTLVYQTTWYADGEPGGLVEALLDLPDSFPHHVRDRTPSP
jgi:PAS domain-containing protein